MNLINDFFKDRGFSFGTDNSDIKPKTLTISGNPKLTDKLKGNVYVYESSEQTNTSFYLICIDLELEELFEVRKHIWNEDKFDLYFTINRNENSFALYYAKVDPREEFKIASFRGDETDLEELEKINKWQFDSGKFWLSYSDFLDRIKKSTRVDKKLIDTLKLLKLKLASEFNGKDKIVQALIDRTLFIKFLEDNHIINSYFYKHYFGSTELSYKSLLKDNDTKNINELFRLINEIFNNFLFKEPFIDENDLNKNICRLIHDMISQKDWTSGQLSLFDFQFDVIPIEFISHIYEVFLEKKQLDEGIFYTPKKLAQLIVDDILLKPGTILDPACGSGMFLVVAFRQIMSFKPAHSNKVADIIDHRSKLLKDFIFGIEKDETAHRIAVFSLYLELFRQIEPEKIKEYIENKLKTDRTVKLFPYVFSDNIKHANSLEVEGEIPHEKKTFDYIVGNPPYFEINSRDDEQSFIDKYEIKIGDEAIAAKDVVGGKQISQCFMLKIKDWANKNTKFGFVVNSSNFYNERSNKFQKFFFQYYQLERLYELTRVKDILFRNAKESVNVLIFNNLEVNNNSFEYYPVEMGIFSNYFNLLIIQDDKRFLVNQQDILNEKLRLRDYLVGNEFDRKLINKLKRNGTRFEELISDDNYYGLARGMEITGKSEICKSTGISESEYDGYSKKKKDKLLNESKESRSSKERKNEYQIPFIKANCLDNFRILCFDCYLNEDDFSKEIFRRDKKAEFFKGKRILYTYIPRKINNGYLFYAHYIKFDPICIANNLYSIRLKKEENYLFVTALLNSKLINYFLNIDEIIRPNGTYTKLNKSNINKIPVCPSGNTEIFSEILIISRDITDGKLLYQGEIKEKLNELIFDLYDLSYLEKTRIKDFFSEKKNVDKSDMETYRKSLHYTLEIYLKCQPEIEYYIGENLPFGLVVTAIYLNKSQVGQPTGRKTIQYIINEILQRNPEEKFLALREKIYGKDCIYIVKNNQYQSWTITKAYEDGQEILKKLRA
ncbi:MAG TPA: N-6 DNA methylase [Candidatus Deferrimicrobium sp.]|nr:N-6 DNA methylase [Candidatus Deferrimicrobium sp.]